MKEATDLTFWQQFGPWCVLAILLLFAIGFALRALGLVIWKMYNRMADALDKQHDTRVQDQKEHAAELKAVHERQCMVLESNTKVLALVLEHLNEKGARG